jgi:hypothetical protein
MVEISLSGSGEGPGWETSRPTLQRPLHAAPLAAPGMPRRRPRCTLGAGVPPHVPPPPAGAAPSQAELGAAPLSLGLDRRCQLE